MNSETNKNLGTSVVGNLKSKEATEDSKSIEEAENEGWFVAEPATNRKKGKSLLRTIRLEYLWHVAPTVAIINKDGEYEIKPSKYCKEGDQVWMIEADNTLTKAKIFLE